MSTAPRYSSFLLSCGHFYRACLGSWPAGGASIAAITGGARDLISLAWARAWRGGGEE